MQRLSIWAVLATSIVTTSCFFPNESGFFDGSTPHMELEPPSFTFPRADPGQVVERVVTVLNVGSGILEIKRVALEASAAFQWWLVESDGTRHAGALNDGAVEIQPGDDAQITIGYTSSGNLDEGVLLLETNLGGEGELEVPIVVVELRPEINVAPRVIDFGSVPPGEAATESVTVSNVGPDR